MKTFIPVKKNTYWIAINSHGDPIPMYGFTFWKKQMAAKVKKEDPRTIGEDILIVPIVFEEAQSLKMRKSK